MVDLDTCSEEPIQFIDSIQDFGALLAIDDQDKIIQAAIGKNLNISMSQILGKSFDKTLPAISRVLEPVLQNRQEPISPLLIKSQTLNQWITCIAHYSDDLKIVELEHVKADSSEPPSVKFMSVSTRKDSLESYLTYVAENIRAITGYDRVMIYKFASDWHGEVVAESLESKEDSFLGHHFPASDIPPPARDLFRKNWVRMIVDVNSPAISVKSAPGVKRQVDLSRSILRSASPIHLEYLRIMGVHASLTLSLICDGRLWGLIACHHFSPKYLEAQQRSVLSLLAKLISSRITTICIAEVIHAGEKTAEFINMLAATLKSGEVQFSQLLKDHKVSLRKAINCDGFMFSDGSNMMTEGITPPNHQLSLLKKFLDGCNQQMIVSTSISSLSPSLQPLSDKAAGIVAVKVHDDWCVWSRQEAPRTVLWAGDPNAKSAYAEVGKPRMSPRLSFEAWKELQRGTSYDWQQYEIEAIEKLRSTIVDILDRRPDAKSDTNIDNYLRVLRRSIDLQAAEIQRHFDRDDLSEIIRSNDEPN